ncbi:hypothetical protein Plec18170_004227 [Paecilomyces lecythidis]
MMPKNKKLGIAVPEESAESIDGILNEAVEESIKPEESAGSVDDIPNGAVEESIKPETSPYLTTSFTFFIGHEEEEEEAYKIHRHFAEQSPVLQRKLENFPIIVLDDIDKTIGHTFVHYLYTKTYETLMHQEHGIPKQHAEYTKSVLSYRAAMKYQLPGLADLAMDRMEEYDKSLPIYLILDVGKDVYRRLGDDDDEWYSDYLLTRIRAAFEADEGLFSQEYFIQGLGEVPRFDKFLVSTMVQLFSEKISALKEHVSPVDPSDVKMNATSTECLEPSISPAPELPPSPSRTFSDQSAPISPRETSPEPEQAEVVEVPEKIYDRLEPITEVIEDYPVERYDGYQEIAQECM